VAQLWFRIPFAGSIYKLLRMLIDFCSARRRMGCCCRRWRLPSQAMLFSFLLMILPLCYRGFTRRCKHAPALQYATLINPLRYAIDMPIECNRDCGVDLLFPGLWPLQLFFAH